MLTKILRLAAAIVVLSLLLVPRAHALLISQQFYDGLWACSLDGRDVRISWQQEPASSVTCNAGYCTYRPYIDVVGWFEETARGGAWVPFSDVKHSARGHITFRHPDGNLWTLNDTRPGVMHGNSTWQGQSYPLVCERITNYDRRTDHMRPMVGNERLDLCRVWGAECGKPAADEWCRDNGRWKSAGFAIDADIGARSSTRVISSGQICSQPFCDGFQHVSCQG